MTYNIRAGQGGGPLSGINLTPEHARSNLSRIADVILDSKAQIVGLQEVDRFWSRSGGIDQPAEIAALLGMHYCYAANFERGSGCGSNPAQYGIAILSAFPILESCRTPLPTPSGWEPRGALSARIQLPSRDEVTVINTHLQYGHTDAEDEGQRQRNEQLGVVLRLASRGSTPAIIVGDFNAIPGSNELVPVESSESGFTDAWTVNSADDPGRTIPASECQEPERRIDYVFVNDELGILNTTVVLNGTTRIASDHYPVIADLHL